MLKKRIAAAIAALAIVVAITGASGVVADSLGLSITPQVSACNPPGSGGGC